VLLDQKNHRTFSFEVFDVNFPTSSSVQWRRFNSLESEAHSLLAHILRLSKLLSVDLRQIAYLYV